MNAKSDQRGSRREQHLTDRDTSADATDPFKDIGALARKAPPEDAHSEQPEDRPEAPARAPGSPLPLDELAAKVIDDATLAIVDNIGALITRAERLKQSIVSDTAEAKKRIAANLNHGARILDMSKRMNTELDELENVHRQQIRGEQ